MDQQTGKIKTDCPRTEIAAYIDGELSPREEFELEMHLAVCTTCAAELNEQKKLLCALDFALEDKASEIELPENFTRVVVANAESKVSGLRCPRERGRALLVCAALSLLMVFGLGAEMSQTLASFSTVGEKFYAVGAFFVHLFHDLTIAVTVILRSLCGQFVSKSAATALAAGGFLVLFLFFLSRLMTRSNRF